MTTITWYGDYIAPDFTDENLRNHYVKQHIQEEGSKNFTIDPLLDCIIFDYFKSKNDFKPFDEYKIIGDKLYAKSSGSLSVGSVNYLMLYSDTEYIIIKNKKLDPITIKGEVFITNLSSVIYRS